MADRAGSSAAAGGLLRSGAVSAASIAAASTSARSTMPGPPPAGVSSTLRCRSVARSRMSRASSAHSPDASALPARLTPSGPGNISGNRVRTVARQDRFMKCIARCVRSNRRIAWYSVVHGRLWVPAFAMIRMGAGSSPSISSGNSITTRPPARSTVGTTALVNGSSIVAPCGGAISMMSPAPKLWIAMTRPSGSSAGGRPRRARSGRRGNIHSSSVAGSLSRAI